MEENFGYISIFNGKKIELYAASLYEAKKKAIRYFRPNRNQEHNVLVMLAEKNGEVVTQHI
jgi:hypothetical protein